MAKNNDVPGGPASAPSATDGAWDEAPALSGFEEDDWGAAREPAKGQPRGQDGHPFGTDERQRYPDRAVLGWGGMGRVTAVDDRRLCREVALKEIVSDAGPDSQLARRLAQEAWITAQLEHPGIVPVYDAGLRADGTVFYTMRLIRGRSLRDGLGDATTLSDRLGFLRAFLAVCEAMAYAHSRGIIHRDLKPDNIMLGEFGEALVVDWGLARPIDENAPAWRERVIARTLVHSSVAGAVVGTPSYMSPEQARGDAVDERGDVWCLGAILHELLCGARPFGESTGDEVLQRIRTERVPLIDAPEIPRELAAIAHRALQFDREGRYRDARELAADAARYLDGERVRAHRYSFREHLLRFIKGYRAALIVGLAAVVVVGVVITVSYIDTVQERDRALAAEDATRVALIEADKNLGAALVEQALVASSSDARPEAEVLATHALKLAESPAARGVVAAFGVTQRPTLLSSSALADCRSSWLSRGGGHVVCTDGGLVRLFDVQQGRFLWERKLVVIEAHYLDATNVIVATVPGPRLLVLDATKAGATVFDTDFAWMRELDRTSRGRHMVHNVRDHLEILNVRTHQRYTARWCKDAASAVAVAVSKDDAELAVVCDNGEVVVGTLMGKVTRRVRSDVSITAQAAAFSHDRQRLVVAGTNGKLAVLDAVMGKTLAETSLIGSTIRRVAVSPDGAVIAAVTDRGGPVLWRPDSDQRLGQLPDVATRSVAFEDEGRVLVTLGASAVQRWRLPEVSAPRVIRAPAGLSSAAVSPDGKVATLQRGDGAVSVHSTVDGGQLATLRWQDGVVKSGAFSLDGARYFAVGMGDAAIHHFRTSDWTEHTTNVKTTRLRRLGSMAGGVIAGIGYTAGPVLVSASDGRPIKLKAVRTFVDIGVGPGGRFAALLSDAPTTVWRLAAAAGSARLEELFTDASAVAVDVNGDGNVFAIAHRDAVMTVEAASGQLIRRMADPNGRVLDVVLSHDQRWVAAGLLDGRALVWNANDGTLVAELIGHRQRVVELSFSDDDQILNTASWDHTLRRWSLSNLETPPTDLVSAVERAWGLGLKDVLSARAH
ncbi:MAG: WD40 repeat protein [Myxococcota bacterium]|jgi:WD40 repeat protein